MYNWLFNNAKWYQFWMPQSGASGGLIGGVIVGIILNIIMIYLN